MHEQKYKISDGNQPHAVVTSCQWLAPLKFGRTCAFLRDSFLYTSHLYSVWFLCAVFWPVGLSLKPFKIMLLNGNHNALRTTSHTHARPTAVTEIQLVSTSEVVGILQVGWLRLTHSSFLGANRC